MAAMISVASNPQARNQPGRLLVRALLKLCLCIEHGDELIDLLSRQRQQLSQAIQCAALGLSESAVGQRHPHQKCH